MKKKKFVSAGSNNQIYTVHLAHFGTPALCKVALLCVGQNAVWTQITMCMDLPVLSWGQNIVQLDLLVVFWEAEILSVYCAQVKEGT